MSKISVAITRLVTNVLHMPRLRLQQDVKITFISYKWLRFGFFFLSLHVIIDIGAVVCHWRVTLS